MEHNMHGDCVIPKLWINGKPVGIKELEGVLEPLERKKIMSMLMVSPSICSIFTEKGGRKGVVVLRLNNYDSTFFGIKIGDMHYQGVEFSRKKQIELFEKTILEGNKQGYEYFFMNVPEKMSFLEPAILGSGFEKCTASLDLFIDLKDRIFEDTPAIVRIASQKDEKVISDIASRAFRRSRLYGIGVVGQDRVDEYHARWILNLKHSESDTVFIIDQDNRPAGFLSVRVNPGERNGRIILLATDEKYRRGGLGRSLLQGVMSWAAGKIDVLYVKTQENNLPALQFYKKNGFEIIERETGYHLFKLKKGKNV